MKMSRDQLKSIIKECLVELLSEGLGGTSFPVIESTTRPLVSGMTKSNSTRRRPEFDPVLDRRVEPVKQTKTASSALKEAIRRESGGNPVIADILADTARTTLPNMLQHGDIGSPSSPGGPSSQITQQEQFNGTPDQIFGEENASKWASLAFMDFPAKKTA